MWWDLCILSICDPVTAQDMAVVLVTSSGIYILSSSFLLVTKYEALVQIVPRIYLLCTWRLGANYKGK